MARKEDFKRTLGIPLSAYFKARDGSHCYLQYELTGWMLDRLRSLPGSFSAVAKGRYQEDDPVASAYYDLLPELLEHGHEGKWLAFGFGPQWHAVGDDAQRAMASLMRRYPDQRPKLWGVIKSTDLTAVHFQGYARWKLTAEATTSEEPLPS